VRARAQVAQHTELALALSDCTSPGSSISLDGFCNTPLTGCVHKCTAGDALLHTGEQKMLLLLFFVFFSIPCLSDCTIFESDVLNGGYCVAAEDCTPKLAAGAPCSADGNHWECAHSFCVDLDGAGTSSVPTCLLKVGQACSAASECISGACTPLNAQGFDGSFCTGTSGAPCSDLGGAPPQSLPLAQFAPCTDSGRCVYDGVALAGLCDSECLLVGGDFGVGSFPGDAECDAGNGFCLTTYLGCQPKRDLGEGCNAATNCLSGHCVTSSSESAVCCAAACNVDCELFCSTSGDQCLYAFGNSPRPCTAGEGYCDGSGAACLPQYKVGELVGGPVYDYKCATGLTAYYGASFPAGAPANDECAGAILLTTVGSYGPFTTFGATPSTLVGPITPSDDVFFAFTADFTGQLTIDMCGAATAADFVIEVFDACDGTIIAYNDDFCVQQPRLEIVVVSGDTYIIKIQTYFSQGGVFLLNLNAPTALADVYCDGYGSPKGCDGQCSGDTCVTAGVAQQPLLQTHCLDSQRCVAQMSGPQRCDDQCLGQSAFVAHDS
jgi:hypothetical protein